MWEFQGKWLIAYKCRFGEGERVIALESWEGNLASRRVEEGLSRFFSGWGRKPWLPSPCAGDLRGLLTVALRSQGNWRWEWPLGSALDLVHWKRIRIFHSLYANIYLAILPCSFTLLEYRDHCMLSSYGHCKYSSSSLSTYLKSVVALRSFLSWNVLSLSSVESSSTIWPDCHESTYCYLGRWKWYSYHTPRCGQDTPPNQESPLLQTIAGLEPLWFHLGPRCC